MDICSSPCTNKVVILGNKLRVPAADKALQVLEIIRQQSSTSIQSLLAQIDISRSSLYALLHTLKAIGYIEQHGTRGSYQPGPRLIAWSHTSPMAPQDLLTAFYQEINAPVLNETTALLQLVKGHPITVARVESTHSIRVVLEPGQEISPELAGIIELLGNPPAQAALFNGFHLTTTREINALGLPVCRDGIHADAALLICAPAHRCAAEDLVSALGELREMAARLSYRLGAQVYSPFQANSVKPMPYTRLMSTSEIDSFLERPWAARLACVRPDGTPHVVPVWHQWDGKNIYVLAWPDSHWANYITTNPSVSITIDEPWTPHRRVSIRGNAQLLEDDRLPAGRKQFIEQFFMHYVRHSIPPESPAWQAVPYHIQPDSINGWVGLQTGVPDGN